MYIMLAFIILLIGLSLIHYSSYCMHNKYKFNKSIFIIGLILAISGWIIIFIN